jgi:hypothetical protein
LLVAEHLLNLRSIARTAVHAGLLALLIAAIGTLSSDSAGAAGGNSVSVPDFLGDAGEFPSLVLDSSGRPVVAYLEGVTLKILHCNDTNCSGGDDSITTPDLASLAVFGTSLTLDGSGNPVVSYWAYGTGMRVLHCNDPNCGGSDESIELVDGGEFTGSDSSIVLDSGGRPVVSFFDGDSVRLGIAHCNDANCDGGDESIVYPDPAANEGASTSLALDASGYPVVSYCSLEPPGGCVGLKVMHCNDTSCSGGGESITPLGSNTGFTSLILDASGNPVVAYTTSLLHCNDPNCTGGDESTSIIPLIESNSALRLNASGHPLLISPGAMLQVFGCNDGNCAGGGDSTMATDETSFFQYGSLALDGAGRPTVAYHDADNGDLKVLRCAEPACDPDFDLDGCRDRQERGADEAIGGLRSPKNFWDFYDVPTGPSLTRNRSVAAPDIFAVLNRFNSSGNPGVSPFSMPPPAPAYHPAYDRGPSSGPNVWNLTAANGSIAATDVFAVIGQFGHSCV